MARPKKYKIDTKQIEQLASFGCSNTEIASFFDCSVSLLTKSYSKFITKGQQQGKIRLRQIQYKRAMGDKDAEGNYLNNGSVPMLIWLGKQMLGQAEQPTMSENELVEGFDIEVI